MRWLLYIYARILGMNHTDAKHCIYHSYFEHWDLLNFDVDSDNLYYLSDHIVSCNHTKCGYAKIKKRAWLKAEAWPDNLGNTEIEAWTKAVVYRGDE